MIHTCTEVGGAGVRYEGEVDALLDEVERDILRISANRGCRPQTTTIKDLARRHHHHRGFSSATGMLTGVGTGFTDLDKRQRAARRGDGGDRARPSMGKTSWP